MKGFSSKQAHALYNSVSVRKPQYDGWKERIFEVQQAYWKGSAGIGYQEQQKINSELSEILEGIRDEGREAIKSTEKISQRFDINPESVDRELMNEFIESAKCVSMRCTAKMKNLIDRIMDESTKILIQRPPCHFEVVAIGSLARGEATPYSDLEYMILVDRLDSSIEEFFTRLSMTSYFLIGSLGETNLKYMAIKELDQWFEDMAKNGLKIDGLSRQAGNIPTGNGLNEKGYKFITTPDALAKAYKDVSDHPKEDSVHGDLTAMLSYMTLLYSYGEGGDNLLSDLKLKIKMMEISKERMHANREMLARDMSKFDFTPDQRVINQAYTIDAKRQLYRFPSILLFDLAVVNRMYGTDGWDTAEKLRSAGIISEDFYVSLMFQLAVACYARLSAYLYHDSQDERISLASKQITGMNEHKEKIKSAADRWYIHRCCPGTY